MAPRVIPRMPEFSSSTSLRVKSLVLDAAVRSTTGLFCPEAPRPLVDLRPEKRLQFSQSWMKFRPCSSSQNCCSSAFRHAGGRHLTDVLRTRAPGRHEIWPTRIVWQYEPPEPCPSRSTPNRSVRVPENSARMALHADLRPRSLSIIVITPSQGFRRINTVFVSLIVRLIANGQTGGGDQSVVLDVCFLTPLPLALKALTANDQPQPFRTLRSRKPAGIRVMHAWYRVFGIRLVWRIGTRMCLDSAGRMGLKSAASAVGTPRGDSTPSTRRHLAGTRKIGPPSRCCVRVLGIAIVERGDHC